MLEVLEELHFVLNVLSLNLCYIPDFDLFDNALLFGLLFDSQEHLTEGAGLEEGYPMPIER